METPSALSTQFVSVTEGFNRAITQKIKSLRMIEGDTTCNDCGTHVPTARERVFIDPHTYCLDCFDATCERCEASIVDDDQRVQKFGTYFCKECAERLCIDCGQYIDDLDNRHVVHGTIRCEECTWCYFGGLCCGCGADISDSIEMAVVNDTHQFCADCKKDLPPDATVEEYPFNKSDSSEGSDSPF